jgi:hypothetical protein
MDPTSVTCSSACTITLVVSPLTATQDQYDAVNAIFGYTLLALCLIWGIKRVLRIFQRPTDA